MQKTILKTIKVSLGAVVFTAILGNSGCLVDTGSDVVDPKPMTQKHIHIYKPNDEIRYNVQIDVYQGTIVTRWDLPVLDEIVDANPLQPNYQEIKGLLKETSTFDYEGADAPVIVVRYITQDSDPNSPTYGSITVHAFNSYTGPAQHNYVHDSTTLLITDPPTPPTAAIIFPSPLQLDDSYEPVANQMDWPIDYYVLPCNEDANTCDPTANQRLQETIEFSLMIKENLETSMDYFQSVKVPFHGTITDPTGGIDLHKVRLDIRAFCGNVNDSYISYSGSQWFYPSIGVVRYEITCNSDSGGAIISATVASVNFPY